MSLPELYKTKHFTKENQLKLKYGDNPTEEQLTEFNTYWDSDKRWEDQDAFERAEFKKWQDSYDNRRSILTQNRPLRTMKQKWEDDYKEFQIRINRLMYDSIPAFKAQQPAIKDEVVQNTVVKSTPIINNQNNQDWHNHMASLGYKKQVMKDGTHVYLDPKTGVVYYNNGRAYNPTTKHKWGYKWQDLRNQSFSYTGQDEYDNVFRLQNDFDNQFNQYIGNQYTLSGNGAQKNRDLLRKDSRYNEAYQNFLNQYEHNYWFGNYTRKKKNGGIINKHQQGGTMNQDIQQQIVQLVQAAMQGSKEATQQINQIMAAAKQGDQKATQLAQMIQAVAQQMQGKSTKAALGAKLNYIQRLKGNCPEGEELVYFKSGGKVDCGCVKKQNGGTTPSKPNNKKKEILMPKKYDGKKHERLVLLNADPTKKLTQAQTDSLNAYAKLYRELPDSVKARDYNDQEVQSKACGGKAKKKK